MSVSSVHPEYLRKIDQALLVRHCVEGGRAVKAEKTKYLPKPNPTDTSKENEARYSDYVARALFVSFTASTLDGMLGMAFRREPEIELDSTLDYMEWNANGSGLSLTQMMKRTTSDVMQTGRDFLIVDYPQADEGLTQAQVEALDLKARIIRYPAEDVINWRYVMSGSKRVLDLVVVKEESLEPMADGFAYETKKQYRVFVMQDGAYMQALYGEDEELVGAWPIKKADGSAWTEIPGMFCGAVNNDDEWDKPTLYDIAEVNISHYRNSADLEDSSYMVGQPTAVLAGLNQSWVDSVLKGGVLLGSRSPILLPEKGSGSLMQASPNQLPMEIMKMKEEQMVKIGAHIIQDGAGNETAEAAKIRFAGQNSKLGNLISNVEDAYNKYLAWAGEFMGATQESKVKMNREFYDARIDPQVIMANIQLFDRGIVAKPDIRGYLRSSGMIGADRKDEDIDADAEDGGIDANT